MRKSILRFGGVMSIFVTIIVMLILFMGVNLYLLEKDYITFNIPGITGKNEEETVIPDEITTPQDQEQQSETTPSGNIENSAITGFFNNYEGKKTGTEVKQLLTDVVNFNTSHDTGINVFISADTKTEEEASKYLAEIKLIDKEGLKSQDEYYAIQSELNYKVFVSNATDGIATDIYIVKIG